MHAKHGVSAVMANPLMGVGHDWFPGSAVLVLAGGCTPAPPPPPPAPRPSTLTGPRLVGVGLADSLRPRPLQLLFHLSDTYVKPIMMNNRIEKIPEPKYTPEYVMRVGRPVTLICLSPPHDGGDASGAPEDPCKHSAGQVLLIRG